MILSEERQSRFARLIIDGVWNDDLVDYADDDQALRFAKKGIATFVSEFDDIDSKVRKSLSTLKRNVPEGSNEWEVLYMKYFEQELSRHGVS
jgi:hypothetical protein